MKLLSPSVYVKTQVYLPLFDTINKLKCHPHYRVLCDRASPQTCGALSKSLKSFTGVLKLFREGKLEDNPKHLNYRPARIIFDITAPTQAS
ncbi:hypothetical protein [Microcoleus sp. EPA2]|uniref:hypothetical protein n=1 Tax=Microcoleus sp. EPA2 TaxID=2841654 RepID=UPI00312B881F